MESNRSNVCSNMVNIYFECNANKEGPRIKSVAKISNLLSRPGRSATPTALAPSKIQEQIYNLIRSNSKQFEALRMSKRPGVAQNIEITITNTYKMKQSIEARALHAQMCPVGAPRRTHLSRLWKA